MNLQMDDTMLEFLGEIRKTLPDVKIFLVGGAVRDHLLKRQIKDLDFVVNKGSVELAKAVKRRFKGVWYTLDDEHQTARVILRQGHPNEMILDFTSFIGATLEEDLRQRDFSINAMAIDLDNLNQIIDPTDGQTDLVNRRLRLCSSNSLLNDPLRVIRAVRVIRSFNLDYSPEITKQLRVATLRLDRISGERVRDELLKCLALPGVSETYGLLKEFGILFYLLDKVNLVEPPSDIIPATDNGDFVDLFNYYKETYLPDRSSGIDGWCLNSTLLQTLEELFHDIETENSNTLFFETDSKSDSPADYIPAINLNINEILQGGRTRKQLLLLFAFFFPHHPSYSLRFDENFEQAKNENNCLEFAERLSNMLMLGQKELRFFELVCTGYLNLISLAQEEKVGPLELYRYFREVGSFGIESALMQIAALHTQHILCKEGLRLANEVILTWFRDQNTIVNPPRLVDGDELMKTFNLKPGPNLGSYLETIREAQVTGNVTSSYQALELVSSLIDERKTF